MARKRNRKADGARALGEALRVSVPSETDVCVVGGGASGLMAAISAARHASSVVLLERSTLPGKTILATGNGRCNLSNECLAEALRTDVPESARYHNAVFAREVMGESPEKWIAERFSSWGLDFVSEDGRLYPSSLSAESVRHALEAATQRAGVTLCPACEVSRVSRRQDKLLLSYLRGDGSAGETNCSTVVLSLGGALTGAARSRVSDSRPSTSVAEALGLSLVKPRAVLCPLACKAVPPQLDGRRVRAEVTLLRGDQTIARERGEVLFRTYGLSGVVVFNLSRVARPGDLVSLNLLPTYRSDHLIQRVEALRAEGLSARDMAVGLVDPVVGEALAEGKGWNEFVRRVQDLRFEVTGTTEETHAQVTRGGVAVEDLNSHTLELNSSKGRGVFVCGEAVDVDGPCGGYNLAWAWRSGDVAGRSAGIAAG